MPGLNWNQIIQDAANETDESYQSKISSLSSLNDAEIEKLITEEGISKQDLAAVLKEVTDATKSNQQKAEAIENITGGVKAVVAIASKFL